MKIRNVAFALLLATATLASSVVFSQNENRTDSLLISESQTIMVFDKDGVRAQDVAGVFVPD